MHFHINQNLILKQKHHDVHLSAKCLGLSKAFACMTTSMTAAWMLLCPQDFNILFFPPIRQQAKSFSILSDFKEH